MAERKGRNESDPNARVNSSSFLSMNPENSRALQMLTADDVLAMKFDSLAAAESFYYKYASAVGFIVRKDDMVRSWKGEVITRRWVCNREGFRHRKHLENVNRRRNPRPLTRVNCLATFSVDLVGHKWLVKDFVAEHTHELATACRSLLQIDPPLMTSENVKKKRLIGVEEQPIQVVDYLAKQFDRDRVGVRRQDLRASSDSNCRDKIAPDDAETLLAYLRFKEAADPELFCKTKFVEGRLPYIFVADETSQLDCACFGDVMAVYRTNSYDLHFVVLAGLGHHHQTTVFGCAILHDGTVEAYSWLFQTFLEVMQGCMPITVVTDGHEALSEAIKHVLPRSRHRLCTWHLEKIALSNVKDPSFISDFKVFMLEVLSPDDFELKWKAMVDKYKLSENPWIHKMYKKRHEWAETYFRGHFWAGLQSTKVCGSIDEHLSRFSQLQLKPYQLMDQYDREVLKIRCNEVKAEYDSKNVKFALSTPLVKIEKHAADVFTRESYKRFLSEMRLETHLFVLEKVDDGSNFRKYKLGKHGHQNLAYEVMFKPSGPSIECSCLKFETVGYPCSHAIHIMKSEGLGEIPRCLIHPRWTKAAEATAQFWQRYLPLVSSDVIERMVRYGTLKYECSSLLYLRSQSDQAFNDVNSFFEKMIDKLERSAARRASNSMELSMPTNEKDDTPVTRITRSKGSHRINEGKRRKTQGDGHSGNVEQTKHGYPNLSNAVIGVGDNSSLGMQETMGTSSDSKMEQSKWF